MSRAEKIALLEAYLFQAIEQGNTPAALLFQSMIHALEDAGLGEGE